MKALATIAVLAMLAGCVSTPEQAAQEAASDRFEDCMTSTLGSVGPFTFGGQEARLKAAEICKEVMQQKRTE